MTVTAAAFRAAVVATALGLLTATASPANASTLTALDPHGDVKIFRRAKEVPKPKSIDA